MSTDTKLRIHNIISKATLRYGSELWIMKRKDQKQLEVAQLHFLRPRLASQDGINKEILALGTN
jgi:hypothetical protein